MIICSIQWLKLPNIWRKTGEKEDIFLLRPYFIWYFMVQRSTIPVHSFIYQNAVRVCVCPSVCLSELLDINGPNRFCASEIYLLVISYFQRHLFLYRFKVTRFLMIIIYKAWTVWVGCWCRLWFWTGKLLLTGSLKN